MSAPLTPIAKNENAFDASPSWTSRAARDQSSVGCPSVIKMIHGR